MALAFRVDGVRANAGGTVEVFYTFGSAPLSAQPSGSAFSLASRLEAVAIKNQTISSFSEWDMFKLILAIYSVSANDPNLTSAVAGLAGKTLTADPSKPATAMVYA